MIESNKKAGRVVGVLFLIIFALGVTVYQILQGPVLFSEDFLTATAVESKGIIISTLLLFLNGILSVVIAAILLPFFKRASVLLAFLYLALCIMNFIAISVDNISVLSLLEVSQEYTLAGTDNTAYMNALGAVFYKQHWWTHYLSLLIACFPVFILYYAFYVSKIVPRILAIAGMIAAILMFVELLSSIFGNSISMNLLLPMGLIQLILPLWLIIKGLNASNLEPEIA